MNKVQVYAADATHLPEELDERAEQLLAALPPRRRQKVREFRNNRARQLSLGAGLLLTHALRQWGLTPDEIRTLEIKEGEVGKPQIVGIDGFHFSLSHSIERVMCAVSADEVGCDVEKIKPDFYEKILRRFSESERKLCTDDEHFFRLWTLKESFMKATGQGFQMALDSFEISLDPPSVRQSYDDSCWVMKEFEAGDGYRYACCARDGEYADDMEWVRLD